jgi:hypothetical protein
MTRSQFDLYTDVERGILVRHLDYNRLSCLEALLNAHVAIKQCGYCGVGTIIRLDTITTTYSHVRKQC